MKPDEITQGGVYKGFSRYEREVVAKWTEDGVTYVVYRRDGKSECEPPVKIKAFLEWAIKDVTPERIVPGRKGTQETRKGVAA